MINKLNSLFILVILTQMSFAGEVIVQSFDSALKQWDQKFKMALYQSITSKVNKLITRPYELKKQIHQNYQFSGRDHQLFNQDFAQVDQNLLRRVKVKFENGQHIVTLASRKQLIFNFSRISEGMMAIDGHRFSIKDFAGYQKIRLLIRKLRVGKKISFPDLIVSPAYAIDPIFIPIVLPVTLAIIMIVKEVLEKRQEKLEKREVALVNSFYRELKQYERDSVRAISKCNEDHELMSRRYLVDMKISNDTTVFMQQLKEYYVKELAGKDRDHSRFLSCEGQGAPLERSKGKSYPVLGDILIAEKVDDVCTLIQVLQDCLNKTQKLMAKRKLTINNQGRYQVQTSNQSNPYQRLVENLRKREGVLEKNRPEEGQHIQSIK